MRISIIEGIFAQIYTSLAGVGSVFVTRYLVMLGATAMQFSILSAIAQFSQVFQILGAYITRNKTTRKSVAINYAFAGRVTAVLFGLIPFIIRESYAIWIVLLVYFVGTALQVVSANAWIAWISDLFPLRIRGRFFGRRHQYLLLAGVCTGYVFGFAMDLFDPDPGGIATWFVSLTDLGGILTHHNQGFAYAVLFVIGASFGLWGLRHLKRQYEKPKLVEHKPFVDDLKIPLKDRNFIKLLVFGIWWMLAIGIGAPFWQPFMIKVLKMSIVSIMFYGTVSTIASLIALRYWGRIIDRFGNKSTMMILIVLGAINPAVWVFANEGNWWIILIEAFTSGMMWSGVGIITINFVLSIAPESHKQIYTAVYSAFSGIGMMITMFLSGALMPTNVNIFSLHPEQVLFALTSIARLTALFPLLLIKEKRTKPLGEVFYVLRAFAKVRMARLVWWRE